MTPEGISEVLAAQTPTAPAPYANPISQLLLVPTGSPPLGLLGSSRPLLAPASHVSAPTAYSNDVEVGISSTAQGRQGGLQDFPGGGLATASATHNHGGVAGVLGFIQLQNLGEGKLCDLQAHFSDLLLNGVPQLRKAEEN